MDPENLDQIDFNVQLLTQYDPSWFNHVLDQMAGNDFNGSQPADLQANQVAEPLFGSAPAPFTGDWSADLLLPEQYPPNPNLNLMDFDEMEAINFYNNCPPVGDAAVQDNVPFLNGANQTQDANQLQPFMSHSQEMAYPENPDATGQGSAASQDLGSDGRESPMEHASGGSEDAQEESGQWSNSSGGLEWNADNAGGGLFSSGQGEERSLEEQIRCFCDPENQRILKPRFFIQNLRPHEAALVDQSTLSQTRQFQGLFANAAAATDSMRSFQNLFLKPSSECTFPDSDATFPSSDEEMTAAVRQVFESIFDWSHILEWKSTLSREVKVRIVAELMARNGASSQARDPESLRPSDEELQRILPPVDVQQQKILGQAPSDQTIEWISWGIVQAAVESQQGNTQLPTWCEADGG
ncbi:hypothetical protein HIM_00948 [Hirsutella minnesotensis 3608]|nr:hypothetical protein HIM_00948 [Hirsutella minnesotensis 3608]